MKSLYMRLLSLLLVLFVSVPAAFAVRTDITPVSPKNPNSAITANSADVVSVSADAANGMAVPLTGRELVYARNTGAGARTLTITSVAVDGRTGDITAYSLGAGEECLFGPFTTRGWQQDADGKLYLTAEHAEVKLLVIKIPVGL